MPWWLALPLIAITLAFALRFGKEPPWLRVAVAVMVTLAMVLEARFFLSRPREGWRPSRIAVIGDSLSSGGFGENHLWPDILSRDTGIPVENLAQPSETLSSALATRASLLAESRADLVIVELGGNDVVEGTSLARFERDLDQLLRLARRNGRRSVMMELPVLPGKWAFGASQRSLARRHDVMLVPKRVLASILTSPANVTSDSLHLSEEGHRQFAGRMKVWLGL